MAAPTVSLAQPAPNTLVEFALPAQPLARALTELARQTGNTLVASPALLADRQAPAVSGRLTARQALDRLLTGSGLEGRIDGGVVTVQRIPAPGATQTLAPVIVTANAFSDEATGPVGGLVARASVSGTKTDTLLLETPQTLTVIPREQIELQEAPTVTRALEYAPGTIAAFGGTNSQSDVVQARGFYPRDYLDGLRLPFSAYSVAVPQFDPYMLERIELLQGPASVLFGQSSPGGVINMVSRRPQEKAAHEVLLQAGNFSRAQLAFDTTGPLNADETLLYRLTGLTRENDGQIDFSQEKRQMIAPSLTWRPSAATSFTLLTHYQHDDLVPQYQSLPAAGTLLPNPNGQLPRTRFPGEPGWDRVEREQYGIGYALQHRFNSTWQFRQNFRYTDVGVDSRALPAIALLGDNRTVMRVATASRAEGSILALDNQAEARFTTGNLHHTLLTGLDLQRQKDDYRFSSQLASNLDLYAPVYGAAIPTLIPRLSNLQEMTQVGLYMQDQIRTGPWVFTLGARHDRADADTINRMPGGTTVSRSDSATTGRVGVNYLFDNGVAPYVSYSTSFEPMLGTDFNSRPFEPSEGKQAEVGIRYQPASGTTLLSLAAYRLQQTNVLTPDTAPGHAGFQVQTGEVEVRGISAEARMQPVRNFELIANYAFTDSEVTRANPNTLGVSLLGRPLPRTPKHTASLWAAYYFDGDLLGLTAGLGVRYLGENYTDTSITMQLPSQSLLDLAIHYDFGKTRPDFAGWKLSLGIANLTDKQYVSYCLNAAQCFWGQPRTAQVTLRKRW